MLDPNSSFSQDGTTISTVLGWCRRHLLVAIGIGIATIYFIGYRVYYCATEGCTHPANWWFHLPPEAQAAWVGSLGTLVAVWWGFFLFWQDRRERRRLQRKAAQPTVYSLISKIEGINGRIGSFWLYPPDDLEVYAKKGKIKEDLLDVEAISTLLEDDELAGSIG